MKPYIFGEEKSQEALIGFFSVFVCRNVFGGERKHAENIQIESKTEECLFFFLFFLFFFLFWSGGALGLL